MALKESFNASESTMYLGLDWLELNVRCKDAFHEKIWQEKDLKKFPFLKDFNLILSLAQSKHYKYIVEIHKDGIQIASISYMPRSTTLPAQSGILKIENWVLYKEFYLEIIDMILKAFEFEFTSISRIDIASDQTCLANGYNPQKFLQDFFSRRILKKRKTFFHAYGNTGSDDFYSGMAFGAKTSIVQYKMYNKTLEMQQKKFKPWVQDTWIKNGYNMKGNVYRIEISIRNNNNDFIDKETGQSFNMKSLEMVTAKEFQPLFKLMFNHFFKFCKYTKDTNKSRHPDIILLNHTPVKMIRQNNVIRKESDRAIKIFINKLGNIIKNTAKENHAQIANYQHMIDGLVSDNNLQEWWMRKRLYGVDYLKPLSQKLNQFYDFNKEEIKAMLVGFN